MFDRIARRATPLVALVLGFGCVAGCAADGPVASDLPRWSFRSSMLFPADGSLVRAEDGVALADGSLVVSDQVHGLRRVEQDGRSAPFGEMPGAGYAHGPPARNGAANGVSLEPSGTHVLVADVVGGGIYRVELKSGATERVYRHRFGVNAAVRDSSGAIWFSQSAHNTEQEGELGMFTPVDDPEPKGALLRLPFQDGRFAPEAENVVDGLHYANGIVLDEARGRLYLSELLANRVLSFPLDVAGGSVGERSTLLEVLTPDNLELDETGRLWVASPLGSEVLVLDLASGRVNTVFQQQSPAQVELVEEYLRRRESGLSRLELLTTAFFDPLPGFVTGVIFGADDRVYVSGLGNALLLLDPASAE